MTHVMTNNLTVPLLSTPYTSTHCVCSFVKYHRSSPKSLSVRALNLCARERVDLSYARICERETDRQGESMLEKEYQSNRDRERHCH
jgi:hypothetical protein